MTPHDTKLHESLSYPILTFAVKDDAGGGADRMIDRDTKRSIAGSVFSTNLPPLLTDALFVSLIVSPVRASISIPAGFSLGFIVTQLGALKTVVGDFLRHDNQVYPRPSR
jgi:hypothetical protein